MSDVGAPTVAPPPPTAAERDVPAALASANEILRAIGAVASEVRASRVEFASHVVEFRELATEVAEHRTAISTLDARINGSNPPPADGLVKPEPLAILLPRTAKQAGETAGEAAELRGQLLAVRAELANQSKAMGIGPRRFDWLPSKATISTCVRVATLAGAMYAAAHAASSPPAAVVAAPAPVAPPPAAPVLDEAGAAR